MRVGVPKEIKTHEYRVGLTPGSVRELVKLGAEVMVETNAGAGIGLTDDQYRQAGARVVDDAEIVFEHAELIIKVKEPQPEECRLLSTGQSLFTYLHLAPDPLQTELLLKSGCTAIAYETVTDERQGLPLLTPMSQVAGRMSIQAGAHCLEKAAGGRGVLLGGVPGVAPAEVLVIGGGVVGTNAVRMAMGMEASVTVLERSLERLQVLDMQFGSKLNTIYSTRETLEHFVTQADLVVGAVLVAGAKAPRLVTRDLLRSMKPGAVVVDVAIDQGGCFETSRPTTHQQPTYVEEGVVHYCVANMPGAVARTSTFALNNAILPFAMALVSKGVKQALKDDSHLMDGLNIHNGRITHPAVAEAMDSDYDLASDVLV